MDAAYGLAKRDDPRTAVALDRVGSLRDFSEHDHRADALWGRRWRQKHPADS